MKTILKSSPTRLFFSYALFANLLAKVTMFMPHKMLHTQPTMRKKVMICRNDDSKFSRKAGTFLFRLVGAPHNTVNAEMNVPADIKNITYSNDSNLSL